MHARTHTTRRVLTAVASAVLLSGSAIAQTTTFSPASGDWNTATNWSLGAVPNGAVTAVISNGRTANITTAVAGVPNIVRVGNNAAGATLNISNSISMGAIQVASANGSFGTVNQSSGNVAITNGLQIASNTATAAGALFSMTGGSLSVGDAILVGTAGTGEFSITGSAPSVAASNLTAGSGSTLRFILDSVGVNDIALSNTFTINTGASLVIDGTSYSSGIASIRLVDAASITGAYLGSNVSFLNFSPLLAPSLSYASGDLTLNLVAIPEPTTYALLLGVICLVLLVRRHNAGR